MIFQFSQRKLKKLSKIDEDLKASAQQLHLQPTSSSTHFNKIIFLIDTQQKLLTKEEIIISTLIDIQNMMLPNMDAL